VAGLVVLMAVAGLAAGRFVAMLVRAKAPAGQGCRSCSVWIASPTSGPLLTRVALVGSCGTCGRRIERRYALVQGATAAVFAALAVRFGAEPALPAFCVLGAALVAMTATDLGGRIIPRAIVHSAALAGGVLLSIAAAESGRWGSLRTSAVGGAAALAAFALIHLVSPAGLGFGDVRLAALVGMFLGWLGPAQLAAALVGGFALAAAWGLGVVVTGKGGYRSALPLAPFMSAAALLIVLLYQPLSALWRA
jgi:leader peptidase (prepilin peptidase)/N-methyltransferase